MDHIHFKREREAIICVSSVLTCIIISSSRGSSIIITNPAAVINRRLFVEVFCL